MKIMNDTRVIKMADIGEKPVTVRQARAQAELELSPETLKVIRAKQVPKGDVFAAAQLAGIQAVKKTPDWIPLCHPLRISHAEVTLDDQSHNDKILIQTVVTAKEQTGVEMEALAAAAAAALTIYDMTKMLDRGMRITNLCLLEKSGGRSGHWKREEK